MGWLQRGYVIAGQGGPEVFLKGADLDDAVREARSVYRGSPVMYDGDLATALREDADEPLPNLDPKVMPHKALEASGLRRVRYEEVMSLEPRDAHAILRPYFKHFDGTPIGVYQQPSLMRKHFMTANAKLIKGAKGKLPRGVKPGKSRGPNLIPHRLAKQLSSLRLPMKGMGFCVGSNAACRSICLVYSGQNPLADKQVPIKLRRSEALLKEPAAWLRMFMWSIQWHIRDCRSHGLVPYVRPNVLSDIPWELVFPEMFTRVFPKLRWYDYTKVAGRRLPKQYDMTFSFNGNNEAHVEYELRRRRRVAVVFYLQKGMDITKVRFMGKRVINGDVHDFRPLDPKGVIVGLTYKPAVKKGTLSQQYKPPRSSEKFVLPVMRDPESGILVVPQAPAQTGASILFDESAPTRVA